MEKKSAFGDRKRFTFGFQDGANEAARRVKRDMQSHSDRIYASGYSAGQLECLHGHGYQLAAERAWRTYCASLPERQIHLPLTASALHFRPSANRPAVA